MRTRSQRLLSMVLALSMLLTFLPVSAFAEGTPPPYSDSQALDSNDTSNTYTDSSNNKYQYTLNTDGTATLTKFTGTNANVPAFVKDHTVTEIAPYAFAILKAGSTTQATPNTLLLSVTLPDSITTIGDHAFADCEALTSIALPDGVTAIPTGTFEYCTSLSSITLPAQLTSIGEGAFNYCTALTSIVLPEHLTTVADAAFAAAGLRDVTIPQSLTTVGGSAFFSYPNAIDTVTYTGTLDQWKALVQADDFADYNHQLLEAPHFTCAAYSITPATPTTPPQQPGTTTPTTPPENTDKPTDKPDTNKPGTQEKPNEPTPPEAPAVEEDDTAAIGYAAAAVTAAFVGWGAYRIGSEVYLKYLLPKDVLLPQNRIQLAELLWEDAGRPAPADDAAYTDVDDTDARQAARWAVENGLLTLPDAEKPEEFAPYRSVSYAKSARAWNKAQQLKENAAR